MVWILWAYIGFSPHGLTRGLTRLAYGLTRLDTAGLTFLPLLAGAAYIPTGRCAFSGGPYMV